MTQYVLPDDLGRRLDELARRKNLSLEQLLEDIADDLTEKAAHREANHLSFIRKLYPMARKYWREVGDEARLALTDEQLDEQFWLIDQDGIPRLKEDEGKVYVAPSPLSAMAGIFDDGPEDLSSTVRETMKDIWKRKARGEK